MERWLSPLCLASLLNLSPPGLPRRSHLPARMRKHLVEALERRGQLPQHGPSNTPGKPLIEAAENGTVFPGGAFKIFSMPCCAKSLPLYSSAAEELPAAIDALPLKRGRGSVPDSRPSASNFIASSRVL